MPYGPELYDGRDRNFVKAVTGLASEIGTGTSSSGAVTVNDYIGVVTTESLTTAQNALFTLTITNNKVAAADWVSVTIGNGTNTQGTPTLHTVTVTASTITIIISNQHASAQAFNGTLKVYFEVRKAL
jgi:hypothetical protein